MKWTFGLAIIVLLVSCVSVGDSERMRGKTYADFMSWKKVNSEPLMGTDSGNFLRGKHMEEGGIREVYANDIAWRVYNGEQEPPFPPGSIILKDTYYANDFGGKGKRWNITVMRKREPGYDPAYGDWEYVTAGPTARVRFQGKMNLCIDCHIAAEKDYVFTWPD